MVIAGMMLGRNHCQTLDISSPKSLGWRLNRISSRMRNSPQAHQIAVRTERCDTTSSVQDIGEAQLRQRGAAARPRKLRRLADRGSAELVDQGGDVIVSGE